MTLCCEVIDFVGFYLTNDAYQRRTVGHVSPMQIDKTTLLHIAHPLVEIEMLDTSRVETGTAAHDAMHLVAFFNQELCQERAVLSSNTSD